jgi:hypothetical protein
MVIGYGITVHKRMFVNLDIGQDQDKIVLMKQVDGTADPREKYGSEVVGQGKMKEALIKITRVTMGTGTNRAAHLTAIEINSRIFIKYC